MIKSSFEDKPACGEIPSSVVKIFHHVTLQCIPLIVVRNFNEGRASELLSLHVKRHAGNEGLLYDIGVDYLQSKPKLVAEYRIEYLDEYLVRIIVPGMSGKLVFFGSGMFGVRTI